LVQNQQIALFNHLHTLKCFLKFGDGFTMKDALRRLFSRFQWSETVKLVDNLQIALYYNWQTFYEAPKV